MTSSNLTVGRYRHISVEPIAGSLGAEIGGVDLASDLSDEVVAEVRRAWLDHLVVFFRGQNLDGPQYVRFATRIGEIDHYPFLHGLPEQPEIIPILKLEHETVNFGGMWHSDTSYLDKPPMATMLLARELPPAGGDTMYANMYAAYEALSPRLQSVLEGLRAINSSSLADISKTREDRLRDWAGDPAENRTYEASHPVVRTHPETGRKALFVNIAHTTRFDGWTDEESRGLLQFLFRWQVRPEFVCRFRWQPGSMAMWDNRCTQHNPVNDYHGYRRLLHRITLKGDTPTLVHLAFPVMG